MMTPKQFVAMVAALRLDGENTHGEQVNSAFEMSIDDAFDTVASLITKAREIRDKEESVMITKRFEYKGPPMPPMLEKYLDGLDALTDGRGWNAEHEAAKEWLYAACRAKEEG